MAKKKFNVKICHVWETEIVAETNDDAYTEAISKSTETMVINSLTGELDEKFHPEVFVKEVEDGHT